MRQTDVVLSDTQLVSDPQDSYWSLPAGLFTCRDVLLVTAKNELHVVVISVRLMGLHSQSYRTNRLPCNIGGRVERDKRGAFMNENVPLNRSERKANVM